MHRGLWIFLLLHHLLIVVKWPRSDDPAKKKFKKKIFKIKDMVRGVPIPLSNAEDVPSSIGRRFELFRMR